MYYASTRAGIAPGCAGRQGKSHMRLKTKIQNVIRRIKQSWGSAEVKRSIWNKEFGEGRWDFIENTQGDQIYDFIAKHSGNGSILDLGCGSGNTGCELDSSAYADYTGVDISDNALAKAVSRSAEAGRTSKNRYFQGDIVSYVPDKNYDVILFRESIYYVPPYKIVPLLRRYAKSLNPTGVIIVRWHDPKRGAEFQSMLRSHFDVVATSSGGAEQAFTVSFRPRARQVSAA